MAIKTGRMDFKRVTLSITGTMASTREYELLKTKKGVEGALYDGSWNYNKLVTRRSCRVCHSEWGSSRYDELAAAFYKLGVPKWDGLSLSDPHVLDGESFSLDIELADGGNIHAHGCNAYPKNYWEFMELIDEAVNGPKEY